MRIEHGSHQSEAAFVLPDSYQVTVSAWDCLPLAESGDSSASDWPNKDTPLLGSRTNGSEAEVSCLVSRQDFRAEMFWRERGWDGVL